MTAATQVDLLLKMARRQLTAFKKLPLAQKKRVAQKNLRAAGIVTKSGKLAAAYK